MTEIPAALRSRVVENLTKRASRNPRSTCIEYMGARTEKGYGRFLLRLEGRDYRIRAHRAVWILHHGPIPDPALVVDHLCNNPACITIEHLELVTNEENIRRGDDRAGRPRREFNGRANRATKERASSKRRPTRNPRVPAEDRTECINGHPWPENLRWYNAGAAHYCTECQRQCRTTKRERECLGLPPRPAGRPRNTK